jgi:hypothetical protein
MRSGTTKTKRDGLALRESILEILVNAELAGHDIGPSTP